MTIDPRVLRRCGTASRDSRNTDFEIDVVDFVPDRVARGFERSVALHARIVAEHVQPAEPADGLLDRLSDGLRLTKIADDRLDLGSGSAQARGELFELSAVTVEKSELCPAFGKELCDRRTDPHRGAGDQRHLLGEFHHLTALFRPIASTRIGIADLRLGA